MDKYRQIFKAATLYLRVRKNDVHVPLSFLYAQRLLELKPGLDKDVVCAAIILHDIGWYNIDAGDLLTKAFAGPDFLTSDVRYLHESEGIKLAKPLLNQLGYPAEFIEKVCAIIDGHDTRKFAQSPEDEIVRDADKLWRFNIVGVCVACDWFKLTPNEYIDRLTADVMRQLHLHESIEIAEQDIAESRKILLNGVI